MTRLRASLFVLCTFLASAGIGHVTAGRLSRTQPDQALALYTRERYNAATESVGGKLRTDVELVLREHVGAAGAGAVLVIVRADDIHKCEDLGRQLRALRHATRPQVPLIAIADTADTSLVRHFLRAQRMTNISVVAVAPNALLQDNDQLPTPAALILNAREGRVSGVAHPLRFPNARFRSFAEELRNALDQVGFLSQASATEVPLRPVRTAIAPFKFPTP